MTTPNVKEIGDQANKALGQTISGIIQNKTLDIEKERLEVQRERLRFWDKHLPLIISTTALLIIMIVIAVVTILTSLNGWYFYLLAGGIAGYVITVLKESVSKN